MYRLEVVGAFGMSGELLAAMTHSDAAPFHGGEVRPSRDEDHVMPTAGKMRAEEAANRPSAHDGDGHLVGGLKMAATERRWTLPVAVVGILSTM